MSNYALIKDGKVFNVIVATPEAIAEIGLEKLQCDEAVEMTGKQGGIGYEYSGGVFTRPAMPAPIEQPKSTEQRLAELETEIQNLKAAK